jgi:hypothetical protein
MAKTARQTAIFGVEDWKRLYQTFREADFQSYDFETLRKSFIDYLRLYYPETFNDYIESSEFIALLDVMAFMGQSLAFRNDLNTRENFIDTAERRDSVVRLANLVGYTPKRNSAAQGFLKIFSVSTTENITDFNGINLSNVLVDWNDPTNPNWFEQFVLIINSALVSSQRFGRPANSQTILGVKTDEYAINLVPGFLPVIPYNTTVDGVSMPFEAVSATSIGRDYVYEPAPRPSGIFNILYRNDQLGFGSANTGFSLLFKQGVLQNQDFNLAEALPNRTVNINIEGINQEDHWLYQLDDVGTVSSEWEFTENIYSGAVEQLEANQRKFYSITSRVNDQITLTFGDGVFAEIPVGLFRSYVRASNGLRYIINPEEMQSVTLQISYVSRTGRLETLTVISGITQTISNAQSRETLAEIKERAPARYYTQNRMVNGEDYNNFPFTQFNSIIKSKAVVRSAVGASRFLELTDVTGKYSSTNIYASDGALWEEDGEKNLSFEWLNRNDILDAITNTVEPILAGRSLQQFYYKNFPRPRLDILNLVWNQSTSRVNETTGFFYVGSPDNPVPVGPFTSNNAQYITPGALIRFRAPDGFFFDENNRLRSGLPLRPGEKLEIWSAPQLVIVEGTAQGQGNFPDGTGAVILNNFVPSGALPQLVIPKFVSDIPLNLEQSMIQQIELFRNFGLGYNNANSTWYLITSTNLDADAPFSLLNARDNSGTNQDASWLIRFVNNGQAYQVIARGVDYVFGSVIETRFFFDGDQLVYDSRTGSVIRDFINVLKVNSRPDSNSPLPSDILMEITSQPIQSDGFVNDYEVMVGYKDSDADGVPDNPDFFDEIVAPQIDRPLVFFQRFIDFDDLERYLLVRSNTVNDSLATRDDIELVKSQYADGQVFYAYQQPNLDQTLGVFYQLEVSVINGVTQRTLLPRDDFRARTGRGDLAFQYRHNSPLNNVIDPGVTNIIDLYVVVDEYYDAYINYVRDITGTVPEPAPPTINELGLAYNRLNDFKMVSDNLVLSSVQFKPLFGAKAALPLQATIKVVRAARSTTSVSEIKSQVIAAVDRYFTLDKWDFGDSFFFSEMAAYLHQQLGSIISSAVLVPVNPLKTFGDLYEIRCAPNEIFVSAATVADVEVIDALTQSNLRTQTPVSGLAPVTTVGAPTFAVSQSPVPLLGSGSL